MRVSNRDAFDLVEGELVLPPVVELGRLRRLVVGHHLGLLQRPAVEQVVRDPGRPEAVTADRGENPGVASPPLDHLEGRVPRHPRRAELLGGPKGTLLLGGGRRGHCYSSWSPGESPRPGRRRCLGAVG